MPCGKFSVQVTRLSILVMFSRLMEPRKKNVEVSVRGVQLDLVDVSPPQDGSLSLSITTVQLAYRE